MEYVDLLERKYLDWDYYEKLDFGQLYDNIMQYIMHNYCSFYLEIIKGIITDSDLNKQKIMRHFYKTLINILIYIYPIIPNAAYFMLNRLNFNIIFNESQIPHVRIIHNVSLMQIFDLVRLKIHDLNAMKFRDKDLATYTEIVDNMIFKKYAKLEYLTH
jgi:valyl-tRNA synthetase